MTAAFLGGVSFRLTCNSTTTKERGEFASSWFWHDLPTLDWYFFLFYLLSFAVRSCCCQGNCKEVVPVDHIKDKGFQSRLTFGSKIRLIVGIWPCLLDCHVAVSTHHDVFFFLNRSTCFTLMTARLSLHHTLIKGRWPATSHSYDSLHHTLTQDKLHHTLTQDLPSFLPE